MKFTIPSPTVLDKLKWNMFLTNEYGKPSVEWVDNFVENFSGAIINGNFVITENHKEIFDKLWEEIEQDLKERYLSDLAHNNYSWYFYRQLSADCNNKIKSEDELRDYILNYSEELHQHLIEKEKEDIENTEQAKVISNLEVSSEKDGDAKDDTVVDVESILDNPLEVFDNAVPSYVKTHKLDEDIIELDDTFVLMNRNGDEITEELLLDKISGGVTVTKSSVNKLIGKDFSSFEEYLYNYILEKFTRKEPQVKELYDTIKERIKSGEFWSVSYGKHEKPLKILYIYGE